MPDIDAVAPLQRDAEHALGDREQPVDHGSAAAKYGFSSSSLSAYLRSRSFSDA